MLVWAKVCHKMLHAAWLLLPPLVVLFLTILSVVPLFLRVTQIYRTMPSGNQTSSQELTRSKTTKVKINNQINPLVTD